MKRPAISKAAPGLTFQIVFGKWANPRIRHSKGVYGVCLGFISVNILLCDAEVYIVKLNNLLKELTNKHQ